MSHWADDRKGNQIHEGDMVEFALPLYCFEEARDTLNGRTANVKKLKPGMPYTAVLTNLDPVTAEYLKRNSLKEIRCSYLRIVD